MTDYEVVATTHSHHVYFGSVRVCSSTERAYAERIAALLNAHGFDSVAQRANQLASESRKRDGI